MAQIVNRAWGGAFVTPLDVEDLPDDVLDQAVAVAVELPRMRASVGKVENKKAEIRKRIMKH